MQGGGLNYLLAHIHLLRFRNAHHETKDWLPGLGYWGGIISVLWCLLMVQLVVGSIIRGGTIELFLVLASAGGKKKAMVCAILSLGWCI